MFLNLVPVRTVCCVGCGLRGSIPVTYYKLVTYLFTYIQTQKAEHRLGVESVDKKKKSAVIMCATCADVTKKMARETAKL
jgi:predicted metal-binding protein